MTATTAAVFTVTATVGGRERVLRAFIERDKADAHAERLDATVRTRTFALGDRVDITWHGWPKSGVITAFAKTTATVRFFPRANEAAAERKFLLAALAEWN
jgi:hypothetical protein